MLYNIIYMLLKDKFCTERSKVASPVCLADE